jgi:hypothetical protein
MHLKLKLESAGFHHNSGAACQYHPPSSTRRSLGFCFPDFDPKLDSNLDFDSDGNLNNFNFHHFYSIISTQPTPPGHQHTQP